MSMQIQKELLRQAEELRRRQDVRLVVNLQRSAFLAAGFIPIGAIVAALLASPVVEVTSRQVTAAGVAALLIVVANGIFWISVNRRATSWREGPDIGRLRRAFLDRYNGYPALIDDLVKTLIDDYDHNEQSIRSVRIWVAWQAALNFIAIGILVWDILALW